MGKEKAADSSAPVQQPGPSTALTAEPTQRREPTGPTRGGGFLSALLSGGLGGALVGAAVSIWLFYAKWPVERDQMLAETVKTVEETSQAKLAQELTRAQTSLSDTQDTLAQLQIEMGQIDRKYLDTLKQIQTDTAKQEGKLVELQRRQAEIKTRALPAREDSAMTRESVEAANAITTTIQSVIPNIHNETTVNRIDKKPAATYSNPISTNKVLISSKVTNNGRYPFILHISVETLDANGADIPVSFWIEGQSRPSGLIQPNQTRNGSTTLVFPEEWVQTNPGIVQIKTIYKCETPSDVIDSLAKEIHVPGIRERLAAKASFVFISWGTVNLK